MTTSLTTFDNDVRHALLDLLFEQWQALGVPFSSSGAGDNSNVIDPEALLWCSLEFIPAEPRLEEGVVEWTRANRDYLIRQRVNRLAVPSDPRTGIWRVIDPPNKLESSDREQQHSGDARRGWSAPPDVLAYCSELQHRLTLRSAKAVGDLAPRASTLLLRARDLLGNDVRHFILVYLLSNPHGGRIRTIQKWAGYTYRSLSDAATKWERAGVLSIEHGYCRLTDPTSWHALLKHDSTEAVIIDWNSVFNACVQLLRGLSTAGRKKIAVESKVTKSLIHEALLAISGTVLTDAAPIPKSLVRIQRLFQPNT